MMSCNDKNSTVFQSNDLENTVTQLTLALTNASETTDQHQLLSERYHAFIKLKKYKNAIADARECVKLRPDLSTGYLHWAKAVQALGNNSQACNIYVNAIKHDEAHKSVLLEPLLELNSVYSKDFIEVLKLGNQKYCNVCRQTGTDLSRCSRCRVVYYCSTGHQKEDWVTHKQDCSALDQSNKYLLAERELTIPKQLPWLELRKPFASLDQIDCWSAVWECLQCSACLSPVFQDRMSESMSWLLTIIKSVFKFNLQTRQKLIVHVLGKYAV